MIAIPLIYAFIAVFVFIVLQEIIGFWAALLTGLLWLPALIIGFITRLLEKDWDEAFLAQLEGYEEALHDDAVDAVAYSFGTLKPQATKFWLFWLAVGICYEVYAIITNKVDTLSERVWYWLGKHWIFRVAFIAFWVWAFVHIVFGPCAFDIC